MIFDGKQLMKQPQGADLDYYGFIYEIDPEKEVKHARYKYLFVLQRIQELFGADKDIRIMDVGCACGIFTNILADSKYDNVIGIDYSETARIDYGRFTGKPVFEKLSEVNDAHYDLVVSIQTIEHMKDYMLFVKECWQKLKPGGAMILTTVKDGAIQDVHHHSIFRFYDIEALANALDNKSGFDIYAINRDTQTGPKLDCWGLIIKKEVHKK